MKKNRFIKALLLVLCATCSVCSAREQASDSAAVLYVVPEDGVGPDSLIVQYYDAVLSPLVIHLTPVREMVTHRSPDNRLLFRFSNITRPVYFSLSEKKDGRPLLDLYLLEPGDQVEIHLLRRETKQAGFGLSFKGTGAAKYRLRYRIDSATAKTAGSPFVDNSMKFSDDNIYKQRRAVSLHLLNEYRPLLSPECYQVMRLDIEGEYRLRMLSDFVVILGNQSRAKAVLQSDSLQSLYRRYFRGPVIAPDSGTPLISKNYAWTLLEQERVETLLKDSTGTEPMDRLYGALKNNYVGPIREKLLTLFVLTFGAAISQNSHLIDDALTVVKDSSEVALLSKMKAAGGEGMVAYNFDLPDTTGKRIHLSDFRGKVVFMDFWFTGCGACKRFYKEVLAVAEKYFRDNRQVAFISVSVDRDRSIWMHSIREQVYSNPDLINLYTDGKAAAHPVISKYMVLGYPRPLVIDKRGVIRGSNMSKINDASSLIRAIDVLLKE